MSNLIKAVNDVLREALDAVDVHPCDVHNDSVRAKHLNGAMAALYVAAAAPQVVADERREWVSNGKDWVKIEKNEFFHGVAIPANALIPAPMIGNERAAFDKLVAQYPVRSLQDAEDFFVFGIQHQKMAAPVQAQEPVAYIWSVNGMVKTGGDSVFDGHEKFYRAPVQPVAVPDGWRDAALESAVQAVVDRAGESESIALINAFDAIRSLKKNRSALPESCSSSAAPAAQGDAKDTERLRWLAETGARISWSMDGEYCAVWLPDERDGTESRPAEGYPLKCYDSWHRAIDAAIAAKAAS